MSVHYHRPRNDLKPLPWLGSLILNKQDGTGQIYMRNRYYDPETGQFTQQDPIGLAGGLNAYGFASGDPVSYADPYGLCPEEQRDKTGRCPGGLSVAQWDWLIDSFDNLSAGAAADMRERLESGRIRLVARTRTGRPAQASYLDNTVEITESFFGGGEARFNGYATPAEGAWVLAHEVGHLLQWQTGILIQEFGNANNRRNRGRIGRMLGAGERTPEYELLQRDANFYACHVTVNLGIWSSQCTSWLSR